METKKKVVDEGQPCNHCGIPVVKRIPKQKPRGRRNYYFEYFLWCPKCSTNYMVESAKKFWSEKSNYHGATSREAENRESELPLPDFSLPQNDAQAS